MRRPLCLLCLFYVAGLILILEMFPAFKRENELLQDKKMCTLSGEVYRTEYKNDKSVLYLNASKAGTPGLRAICYVEDREIFSKIKIGNQVSVRGTCRLFDEASNDGQFDGRMYYRIQGISCFMTGCQVSLEDNAFKPYEQGLFTIRCHLSQILERSLPERYAGIMQAMFLGEKDGLDGEIKELFQRNGISHILAISGLHISFLGMGLFRLLKKIRIPPLAGAVFSTGFIVSFGIMTGNSASTIRSIVMFLLFILAGLCGRTYDMLTAAALSAAVLLLKQPLYIYHSGFLLSFGAVTGIALLMPSVENLLPEKAPSESMILNRGKKEKAVRFLKQKIKSSITASFSISLATLPIQLYFFYTFPLYSVFLNLFIIPLTGILMVSGATGLLLSCVAPFWGTVFMMPCKWILSICEGLCRLFDSLPGGNLVLGKSKLWQILLYYGLLLWMVFMRESFGKESSGKESSGKEFFGKESSGKEFFGKGSFGKKFFGKGSFGKKSFAKKFYGKMLHEKDFSGKRPLRKNNFSRKQRIFIILAGVFLLCIRPRGATVLTMLDIGQGDCMVIEEKSGYNILVDGGSSDVSKVGLYRIIPYLKSHGIGSLDYVFVSHADSDHMSGILEMLSEEGKEEIKIKHLVLTKFAMSDSAYNELLAYANQKNIKVLMVSEGDRFEIGNTCWECLYPETNEAGDGNDQSMVLFMECGGIGTLFTGDLPGEKEEKALEKMGDRNIHILKVAHHGSKYSTTEEFLKNCLPRTAIVSAGKNNSYGHPHKEVLERLEKRGCGIYGTYLKGAITIRYEKRKYSVLTYKKM